MIPNAVRAKAERANQLIKGDQPAPVPAAATPPATPAVSAELATLKAQLEQAQKDLLAANTRYNTLQGKYNAENPRLRSEVENLTVQVTDLTEKLNRRFEAGNFTSLSEDERRLAGDGLLEVIGKVAREAAAGEFDGRIKPINSSVESLQKQSEANYFATLDAQVPGWEAQNDNSDFIAWLNGIDPASGRLRFDLLKLAEGGRQGYRVAEIFKAFREKREIGAQASDAPAKQPNIDPPPGGGGGAPMLEGEQGKLWKQSDIRAFYNDKRVGKYRGREDEARAIEADILAAGREGRVRTG